MAVVKEDELNYAMNKAKQCAEQYKNWRWGQCVFNVFYAYFPEITDPIRGTDDDCFYDDNKVEKFLSHFQIKEK